MTRPISHNPLAALLSVLSLSIVSACVVVFFLAYIRRGVSASALAGLFFYPVFRG